MQGLYLQNERIITPRKTTLTKPPAYAHYLGTISETSAVARQNATHSGGTARFDRPDALIRGPANIVSTVPILAQGTHQVDVSRKTPGPRFESFYAAIPGRNHRDGRRYRAGAG